MNAACMHLCRHDSTPFCKVVWCVFVSSWNAPSLLWLAWHVDFRLCPSCPWFCQVGYLNKMSDMVRGQLTKIERNKLVALITMEIHNR